MSRYDITVGDCEGRIESEAELADLREQVKVLREALKLSDGMLSDFLRSMPPTQRKAGDMRDLIKTANIADLNGSILTM